MTRERKGIGLLAGCLVFLAGGSVVHAAKYTAADILRLRPHQEGVIYSTPSAQEQSSCTVELLSGERGGSGWLVRDPQGRPLRKFFDTNGDRKIDVWSYYLDGVEVYREFSSQYDPKPDQFRWLNSGGMKWGVDLNKDGKIDGWKMISAEEVSQEILLAVINRDFNRIQALFITETEIKALDLPAAEAARLLELQKQAYAKFQNTVGKLTNINDKTRWLHLETTAPQCVPAETLGNKQDVIKYARGTILCETNGKNDWIQTGELIKVGLAWRIIDAPTIGDGMGDLGATPTDPAVQALLDQLRDLDARAPKGVDAPGPNTDIVDYNLQRANLLEQIVAKVKPEEREQWIRQVADCLSAAAQNSPDNDRKAYQRLARLEEQIIKAVPNTPVAAYVTFREMSADNAAKLAKPGPDIVKVQEQWLERLTKFVDAYPRAEDAPEALMQLGMVSEFVNKETEAKKWYQRLAKDFSDHPLGAKAQGALRRLDLEGKSLELSGSLLDGGRFNIEQLRGKTVIVYYWASWNKDRCVGDFATLRLLLDKFAAKGLALVCVNLDNTAEEANAFLQRSPAPGFHLFQPGGLESPLATQYGVMVLPNLFLVDKDGKVVSRAIQQVGGLEDELSKRLK
ncbi:MAG TPA: thioredoxin-like domain-containing protein [Gemmataceae bacterium]|nr:thioredoxin-like domain-containing protein [Gemmataceae bacterium]